MAKPGSVLTHSTDLNYGSGPANGFPTKVAIPSAVQGFIPGDDLIPEYLNSILNFVGTWIQWQFDGSSAGAADAHVVETDASGDTNVVNLTASEVVTCTAVDADDSAGVNGRIRLNTDVNDGAIIDMSDPNGTSVEIRKSGGDALPLQIYILDPVSGTGANNGQRVQLNGGPAQAQAGAVNNNDGGNVQLGGGPPGTGGTGEPGSEGWIELKTVLAGSFGLTGHYQQCQSFQVDGSTTEARRIPTIWGVNQSHWLKVRLVGRTSGGAKRYFAEHNFQIRTDGAGVTTFTGSPENPSHEIAFGWTLVPLVTLGSPAIGYVTVNVQERDGDDFRCAAYIEVIQAPQFS